VEELGKLFVAFEGADEELLLPQWSQEFEEPVFLFPISHCALLRRVTPAVHYALLGLPAFHLPAFAILT
jgi:hypothetical protein